VLPGEELPLLLQEGLEVVFGDAIDPSLDPAAVVDPLPGRVVKGRWDVDADPLVARAGMEIEGGMLLALLTAAVGLAAGAVLEHERAAEQGLVGEELDRSGSSVALLE
jgi:hypothetical protein